MLTVGRKEGGEGKGEASKRQKEGLEKEKASMRTNESGINNLFSLVGTRRGEQASGA